MAAVLPINDRKLSQWLKTAEEWRQLINAAFDGVGTGNVTSAESVSVDNELVVFSGTSGHTVKRGTAFTGIIKATAGVVSAAVAGTDYQAPLGFTAENVANKSTSTALGSSNLLYPTQNAVKTYVDAAVTGLLDDRGNYDASSNLWPSSGGSGPVGAVMKGDLWFVSVTGTLGGNSVAVGSSIRALVDLPGQTAGNWDVLNVGLGFTPLNRASNLSDLASVATARSNLGLGTAALLNTGSTTGTIPTLHGTLSSNNLLRYDGTGIVNADWTYDGATFALGTPVSNAYFSLTKAGAFGGLDASLQRGLVFSVEATDPSSIFAGYFSARSSNTTGATGPIHNSLIGVWGDSYFNGTTATGRVDSALGGEFTVTHAGGASTSMQDVYGVHTQILGGFSGAAGSFGNVHGVYADIAMSSTVGASTGASIFEGKFRHFGSGTLPYVMGLRLAGWNKASSTITTSYGIYMDTSIDVGTTKWALYSLSTSASLLSGDLSVAGILKTGSTPAAITNTAGQVLFNQLNTVYSGTRVVAGTGASWTEIGNFGSGTSNCQFRVWIVNSTASEVGVRNYLVNLDDTGTGGNWDRCQPVAWVGATGAITLEIKRTTTGPTYLRATRSGGTIGGTSTVSVVIEWEDTNQVFTSTTATGSSASYTNLNYGMKLASFGDDSAHRVVTDTQIAYWNGCIDPAYLTANDYESSSAFATITYAKSTFSVGYIHAPKESLRGILDLDAAGSDGTLSFNSLVNGSSGVLVLKNVGGYTLNLGSLGLYAGGGASGYSVDGFSFPLSAAGIWIICYECDGANVYFNAAKYVAV